MKLYKQLLDSGAVSVKDPKKQTPKKAPVQKAPPKKKVAVRKVKFENGRMIRYTEYQ